ncbi:CheR family methyltransferase [Halalkalibacillus halophilus]|uniref:CheR family methyltransferase n=1 Tax=Halalkalibacillus halophilus TaxID=392827 RepID=UPI000408EC5E|nr:protein-glutamate O-methyltransferase CheR [Halalkalibacillus halophilus]
MKEDYVDFIDLIKTRTGIDLAQYKEKQMKRRLTTLRDKRGFKDFVSYYNALKMDDDLFHEFLDRMTINVSEFYRNSKRWEIFRNSILPSLMEGQRKLKIWSAACSTGEEPYTIAMILSDYYDLDNITIHATDIDTHAIDRAKNGVYPERSLKEVPEDKKKAFFNKNGAFYEISDQIKKCVNYSKHNLLADSYESSYDLIVCRNVLIYFTEEAKNNVYANFANALRKDGVLFVGSTEQIFHPQSLNLEVPETFFYRKK